MDQLISTLSMQPMNEIREKALQNHMERLLIACCHRVKRIHITSRRLVEVLLRAFPQCLFHNELLTGLLELLELLAGSCERVSDDEVSILILLSLYI